MTAYFLQNLTQLRVYWTTEWKMRLSNLRRLWTWVHDMDPHFGLGKWTTFVDWVHATPVMDRVHGLLFLNNEK